MLINPMIQEAQLILSIVKKQKTVPKDIIIIWLKASDNIKCFRAVRKKNINIMYIGMEIRMRAYILSTTIQVGKREKYLTSTEKLST